MPRFPMMSLVGTFAFALSLNASAAPAPQRPSTPDELDRSIKPGDDFYRYANGGWLKTVVVPAGQANYGTSAILTERAAQQVRKLVQDAAAAKPEAGSVTEKVGAYYASFMDENSIEAKGLTPIADPLAKIAAITNKASLSAYLGTTFNSEVDGLVSNADHVFGVWVNQGFHDSTHNLPHVWQGGLGIPDRDSYLDPSPKAVELRAQYRAHIAAILTLGGVAHSDTKAAGVLALEVQIAQAHAPDSEAAEVAKQDNLWKRADFSVKAPGIDWGAYWTAAGLAEQSDFTVWQPAAVTGTAALVDKQNIEVWKDYLRFHLIEHYASVLPKRVGAEDFAFYGKILAGKQQPAERDSLALAATNGALPQAVGKLYTDRYFPPEAKAKAQAMVADVITAYRTRIPNLTWMSPQTKEKALVKLAALKVFVGYPDAWIDYSSLNVVRGDAFGNLRRAEAFTRARNLSQLKSPVFPIEWPMNPQTMGAIIMFSPNAEYFSAALLQPPYFDYQGDAASNYGSAGAGLAHEVSHSFDELGNIYDAQGRLGNWWTAEDTTQYHAAAGKLVTQFDGYCPLPKLCVKGKAVLSENIADIAGLRAAHDAYVLSLKGKPDAVIGGMTGEQRFFLAFGQRWRKVQTEAALRQQINSDTHSPGEYRSDTVRNVDAWYKAYGVTPNDKLYLKPEDRVGIW